MTFVLLVCSCGAVARADSFQTFNLNATLAYSGSANGTLTLDTTTGLVTGENVLVTVISQLQGPLTTHLFNTVAIQGDEAYPISVYPYTVFTYAFTSALYNAANGRETYDLLIELPLASLIGYSGSAICSSTFYCAVTEQSGFAKNSSTDGGADGFLVGVESGTLTPAAVPAAVTPEPSGLWLLGTGLVGLGLMMRTRLRVALVS